MNPDIALRAAGALLVIFVTIALALPASAAELIVGRRPDWIALNPQPLPPKANSVIRRPDLGALNPQPLPPRLILKIRKAPHAWYYKGSRNGSAGAD
jgi:hypothetical protein